MTGFSDAKLRHRGRRAAGDQRLGDGCGKKQGKEADGREEAEAPTPVTGGNRGARRRSIAWSRPTRCCIRSNQANVTSKISAPVTRVLVNRGDHVSAGQVLAVLESADLAAAANESQHQYRTDAGRLRSADRRDGGGGSHQGRRPTCRPRGRTLDAARKLYDNRVAAQKEGALAQKLVDEAQGRHGAGAESSSTRRSGIWMR